MARSSISGLNHLFADTAAPIYALDDERRIIFCNAACASWLGIEPDKLLGIRCDFHSVPQATPDVTLASGLCPPPAVFLGERQSAVVVREPSAAQPTAGPPEAMDTASLSGERRQAEFFPLRDDANQVIGVLAIVETAPLTDADGRPNSESIADDLHSRIRDLRTSVRNRFSIDRLAGDSPAMQQVREQVRVAIAGRARVLVLGPTGSGRERLARTIHAAIAQDSDRTFLPLPCSLLDAEVWHSSLATALRPIRGTEVAATTLLLLDIDQLQPDMQTNLARWLAAVRGDMSLFATSRKSLTALAAAGGFRPDLAAMISTLVIELPPLAQRPQDIPLLAQAFVEEWNVAGKQQLGGFAPDALAQLSAYPWPGNADELAQVVWEACQRADGALIQTGDLPVQIGHASPSAVRPPSTALAPIELDKVLEEIERELIERALRHAKGNKAKAARLLGVTRARLHRRVDQLDSDKSDGQVIFNEEPNGTTE